MRTPGGWTRQPQLVYLPTSASGPSGGVGFGSAGKIRADVVHERLVAMGFAGSDRTTRRTVAELKAAWRSGHSRLYRPWVPEPGMWLEFDWGDGPRIAQRRTRLFCAWLAWSRY